MSTLQEQLDRLIKRKGEQDPLVQVLRDQIAAQKGDQGLQELYLTGSVKMPESGNQVDFVLEGLKKYGIPLTRENYLGLAYPDGVPEDLDESSLPPEIRQQ
jgi:hypothetical protein